MYFLMLAAPPLFLIIVAFFFSKGGITKAEFFTQVGTIVVLIGISIGVAYWQATGDHEIWGGRVQTKAREQVSCSHSYSCHCHEVCSGSGKNSSCSEHCDTCYEHAYDVDWAYYTTYGTGNAERNTIDRISRQGLEMPPRWGKVFSGEPAFKSVAYENYILAAPQNVLRRRGALAQFQNDVPNYPGEVYDYYRTSRLIDQGVPLEGRKDWEWLLNELNADMGPQKQASVILFLTNKTDSAYEYAVEEKWIGGKKNDIVILIGAPNPPKIEWVRILSWTKSEDFKVMLRDDIQGIGTLERRDDIFKAIRSRTINQFRRRSMKDFKYLMADYEPSKGATIFIFILGLLVAIGTSIYFHLEDPFGDTSYGYGRTRYRGF